MKRKLQLVLAFLLISACVACSGDKVDANDANAARDAGNKAAVAAPAAVPVPAPVPPKKVVVPKGTHLRIALIDGVSTTKSAPGDTFMASLIQPVVVDGQTLIESGTKVRGRVTDVAESGRVKGRARIQLILTDLMLDGKEVPISTNTYSAEAASTKKRDAEIVGGGAGVGALIGAIAGGGKGAAIGTAVGAGAGGGTVLATKGKELHYPPETKLNFTLASPVEL